MPTFSQSNLVGNVGFAVFKSGRGIFAPYGLTKTRSGHGNHQFRVKSLPEALTSLGTGKLRRDDPIFFHDDNHLKTFFN